MRIQAPPRQVNNPQLDMWLRELYTANVNIPDELQWTRVGFDLYPLHAGDSVQLGTGSITAENVTATNALVGNFAIITNNISMATCTIGGISIAFDTIWGASISSDQLTPAVLNNGGMPIICGLLMGGNLEVDQGDFTSWVHCTDIICQDITATGFTI